MSSRTERDTARPAEGMRLDKWLWAARFYKTRALAVEQIDKGRVQVNGTDAKPAREVRPGDTVRLRQARDERVVVVRGLSALRGPAPVAQQLYEETAASVAARAWRPSRRWPSPTAGPPSATGAPSSKAAAPGPNGTNAGPPAWTIHESDDR